ADGSVADGDGAACDDTGSNGTRATKCPREEWAPGVEQVEQLIVEHDGLQGGCGGRIRLGPPVHELPAARRLQRTRVPFAQLPRARRADRRDVEPHRARTRVEGERRDRGRTASEAGALPLREAPLATRIHISRRYMSSYQVRWQSDGVRRRRARLPNVQDGWRVRVPASSANV